MFGGFGEPDLAKPPMDRDGFRALVSRLTAAVVGQPLDAALGERLNRDHPPGSETYEAIFAACRGGKMAELAHEYECGEATIWRALQCSRADLATDQP